MTTSLHLLYPYEGDKPLGSSAVWRSTLDRANKIAAHDATVLVQGEAGTGKSLLGRLIHTRSRRADLAMGIFECGAWPAERHEALLFASGGLLEALGAGTLILRDVPRLSGQAQASLLKGLPELECRLISTALPKFRDEVTQGRFNEELYWKLCGVTLDCPPLRERENDTEELLATFLESEARAAGKPTPKLAPAVAKALTHHGLPGNVGELKALARLLINLEEQGQVPLSALPAQLMVPPLLTRIEEGRPATPLKPAVHEFERQFIERVLRAVGHNQSRAAAALDIHRNTLILKMQELGILNRKQRKGDKIR